MFTCMALSAGIKAEVGVTEEFSYSRFNHSPYEASPEFPNRFRTTSLMLDSRLSQSIVLCFHESFGMILNSGFGFNHSVFDMNRFASIPDSLNGIMSLGPVIYFENQSIFLSMGIKSSCFLNNKYWITQIGTSCGYAFDATYVKLSLYISYWYNTNFRTIATGFGIQFGN